uniref:Uncharacterized protein n=1 Tax=Poecilia mexicana TaxID=48701 RepID=A0A3B3YN91_9TELE
MLQIVYVALHQKPGGEDVLKEYNKTKSLSDPTRRKLVNILVADMIESHGRVPPVNVRITYALGIVTLFPNLKDNCSPTGYIEQDFIMLFGEDISGKFIARWPTFYKPKVITVSKREPQSQGNQSEN